MIWRGSATQSGRREVAIAGLAALGIAVACADPASPSPPLPSLVNVELRDALIAPTKVNGAPWDGMGSAGSDVAGAVAKAMGATNPYQAVIAAFSLPAIATLERPEPYGSAKVFSRGAVLQELKLKSSERDTFTPIWESATAIRVPFEQASFVEVTLMDKDLAEDDAIGTLNLTYSDLVGALRSGEVFHVNVSTQGQQQVLFVGIAVYPSG